MSSPPAVPPTPPFPPTGHNREFRVDLAGCTTKAELLARLAAALHFPDWFGHNWDALADCLTDLSWLPAERYAITLLRPQALRAAAPEALTTALEILDEAAAYWTGAGVGFTVTLSEDAADDSASRPAPPASPR